MRRPRECCVWSRACARRAVGAGAVGVIAGLAGLAGPLAGAATADVTASFTTPGKYTLTVPGNVASVVATAIGGAGGMCGGVPGGVAASVAATFAVTPGQQLSVTVAGPGQGCGSGSVPGGFGGGGVSGPLAAGGGGASTISGSPFDLAGSALLVAAGGGGSSAGAGAGANAGTAGSNPTGQEGGGGAGTATTGGAGGADNSGIGANGGAGGALTGGAGGPSGVLGGGGGGGGLFGGGGGGAGLFGGGGGAGGLLAPAGPGGGGASLIAAAGTNTTGPALTSAAPDVTITYATATADLSSNNLALGSEPQGSIGVEQKVTVTNNGDAPLIVSGLQGGGADPGDYLISDRCQLPVAPGASCQIGVRFAPQQEGDSSARLTLLTNVPTAPAPIALSGAGTAPAAGATGPRGTAGPQGPIGATGPAGAAGTIVCRNTQLARALCTLEFAPGAFTIHAAARHANSVQADYLLTRSGRRVAAGTITGRIGRVTHQSVGRLVHGRYTLTITTGHGRRRRVLLTYRFRVR